MSYDRNGRPRAADRRSLGKPALLSPDRAALAEIAKHRDGLPKRQMNPFKLAHLTAAEYVIEKGGMITVSAAGLRWLQQE